MNYFEFFGLPVGFKVDEAALKRQFYANSKRFHPDFHTLADNASQAGMLELSTLNNEAYRTLADPNLRMKYVLELKGLLAEAENPPLPQDFLMEMMELNEAVMELEFDPDPGLARNTREKLETIERELQQQIQPILDGNTAGMTETNQLLEVRNFYLKKKYLLRVRENLAKFATL